MRKPWFRPPPTTNPTIEAKSKATLAQMDTSVEDLLGVHLRLKALLDDLRREVNGGPTKRA